MKLTKAGRPKSRSHKWKILSDEAVLLNPSDCRRFLISERVSLNLLNTIKCLNKNNNKKERLNEVITMEKKMTKKEMFGRLIEIVEGANIEDTDAVVEFLNHEIELVSKKRNGQTKTQKENEKLVEVVFEAIANAGHPVTVTELFKAVESDEIKSAQKLSALVKKLKDADRIVRTEDKKKAYFSIAE